MASTYLVSPAQMNPPCVERKKPQWNEFGRENQGIISTDHEWSTADVTINKKVVNVTYCIYCSLYVVNA